jgi:hypothetical protein
MSSFVCTTATVTVLAAMGTINYKSFTFASAADAALVTNTTITPPTGFTNVTGDVYSIYATNASGVKTSGYTTDPYAAWLIAAVAGDSTTIADISNLLNPATNAKTLTVNPAGGTVTQTAVSKFYGRSIRTGNPQGSFWLSGFDAAVVAHLHQRVDLVAPRLAVRPVYLDGVRALRSARRRRRAHGPRRRVDAESELARHAPRALGADGLADVRGVEPAAPVHFFALERRGVVLRRRARHLRKKLL